LAASLGERKLILPVGERGNICRTNTKFCPLSRSSETDRWETTGREAVMHELVAISEGRKNALISIAAHLNWPDHQISAADFNLIKWQEFQFFDKSVKVAGTATMMKGGKIFHAALVCFCFAVRSWFYESMTFPHHPLYSQAHCLVEQERIHLDQSCPLLVVQNSFSSNDYAIIIIMRQQ